MSTNRTKEVAADQQLADGLTQNASKVGTIPYDGKQYAVPEVVTVLQDRIARQKAAAAAKANLSAASLAAKTELESSNELLKAVRTVLRFLFASDPATLASMGLAPQKTPSTTPAVKAAAAVKAQATKEARGIKGKKQRAAIKAPAPVAAAEAPATAAAPEPPPAPGTAAK